MVVRAGLALEAVSKCGSTSFEVTVEFRCSYFPMYGPNCSDIGSLTTNGQGVAPRSSLAPIPTRVATVSDLSKDVPAGCAKYWDSHLPIFYHYGRTMGGKFREPIAEISEVGEKSN